jgi:choline dehydrogenase
VLLLEAGPDYPNPHQLPDELKYDLGQAASQAGAPHNWNFVGSATPQQPSPSLVPRGKVTGGTSAINHQIFLRGAPEDFDYWAELGNDEWSYLKVLPYFRKLETDLDIKDDFHGSTGPIPVRRHKQESWLPLQSAFYEACTVAGFPEDSDMNHPESGGVGAMPLNNPEGVRTSTALTYLNSSRHRLNLTIKANVLVRRILFDGNKAIGVQVESSGERFVVEGEEIILSAGAIASPQLLMLSGVGPSDRLLSLGIDVVHDLSGVGKNMENHPSASIRFLPKASFSQEPDVVRNQVALRFTSDGSGTRNDIQIQPTSSRPVGGNANEMRIGCRLELPVSLGELTLTSVDPNLQPHLDYRFLVEPWDRKRLREAVRRCIDLLEHRAFQNIIGPRVTPTSSDLASDEALDVWLQRTVSIAGHTACTCRMGLAADPLAVVDQYCHVYGLRSLRVVDASVMPKVVRANTNATVIMMGERVADLIQQGL